MTDRKENPPRMYHADSGIDWYEYLKTVAREHGTNLTEVLLSIGYTANYYQYYRSRDRLPNKQAIDDFCNAIGVDPTTVPRYSKMLRKKLLNKKNPANEVREKDLFPPTLNERCKECIFKSSGKQVSCITDGNYITEHTDCPFFSPSINGYLPNHLETLLLKFYFEHGTAEDFRDAKAKGTTYWAEKIYDYMVKKEYIRPEGEYNYNVVGALCFACWGAGLDIERNNTITSKDIDMFLSATESMLTFYRKYIANNDADDEVENAKFKK